MSFQAVYAHCIKNGVRINDCPQALAFRLGTINKLITPLSQLVKLLEYLSAQDVTADNSAFLEHVTALSLDDLNLDDYPGFLPPELDPAASFKTRLDAYAAAFTQYYSDIVRQSSDFFTRYLNQHFPTQHITRVYSQKKTLESMTGYMRAQWSSAEWQDPAKQALLRLVDLCISEIYNLPAVRLVKEIVKPQLRAGHEKAFLATVLADQIALQTGRAANDTCTHQFVNVRDEGIKFEFTRQFLDKSSRQVSLSGVTAITDTETEAQYQGSFARDVTRDGENTFTFAYHPDNSPVFFSDIARHGLTRYGCDEKNTDLSEKTRIQIMKFICQFERGEERLNYMKLAGELATVLDKVAPKDCVPTIERKQIYRLNETCVTVYLTAKYYRIKNSKSDEDIFYLSNHPTNPLAEFVFRISLDEQGGDLLSCTGYDYTEDQRFVKEFSPKDRYRFLGTSGSQGGAAPETYCRLQ